MFVFALFDIDNIKILQGVSDEEDEDCWLMRETKLQRYQAVMNGSGHNSIWLTNRITPPIIKPTV